MPSRVLFELLDSIESNALIIKITVIGTIGFHITISMSNIHPIILESEGSIIILII